MVYVGTPVAPIGTTPPIVSTIGKPADEVVEAILAGVVKVHRRIEIYERDGITPLGITDWDSRLITGSVTVDGTRDERRMIDVTLNNGDFALNLDPYGGFYYDKILKAYWGIEYYSQRSLAVVQTAYKNLLLVDGTFEISDTGWDIAGYALTRDDTQAHTGTYSGLATVSGSPSQVTPRPPQMRAQQGQEYLLSFWIYASTDQTIHPAFDWFDIDNNYLSSTTDDDVALTAATWTQFSFSATAPTGTGVAYFSCGPTLFSDNGDLLWIDDFSVTGPGVVSVPGATNATLKRWEIQIGEFMIDQIDEERFPYQTHVTGRDYTKKCLVSDITNSLAYDTTYTVEQIITGLAANAGITKFRMPFTGLTFGDDTVFDIGTPRWSVMSAVADAVGYEIYFTADGYLTMRPYQDPVLTPLAFTFNTGSAGGTLVSYKRTSDDSLLKNHCIVIGATATDDLGVSTTAFGESVNDDPSSPTNRDIMGDRVDIFNSDYITTDADAQALADQRLRVQGLEEFSVDFSSLYIPWLDANDIVMVENPNESADVPVRFLFQSFTLPLDLGPMSGTAKRVTLIGTSVTVGVQA